MPYIEQKDRLKFESSLYSLIEDLRPKEFDEGELNYVISKILGAAYDANPRYATINKIMGVMLSAQLEFYRRKAAPYEDKKIVLNGDV